MEGGDWALAVGNKKPGDPTALQRRSCSRVRRVLHQLTAPLHRPALRPALLLPRITLAGCGG